MTEGGFSTGKLLKYSKVSGPTLTIRKPLQILLKSVQVTTLILWLLGKGHLNLGTTILGIEMLIYFSNLSLGPYLYLQKIRGIHRS